MFLAPRKTNIDPFEKRLLHHRKASPTFVPMVDRRVLRTAPAARSPRPEFRESAIDEVLEFQETLHRFREGTSGLCDACGHRISTSGILFPPQATLCPSCRRAVQAL
jgi:RNA polymerase-binding transcription factor DksA